MLLKKFILSFHNRITGNPLFKLGMLLIGSILSCGVVFAAGNPYVVIGTGSINGVYYPTGAAISWLINHKHSNQFRTVIKSTSGSLENLEGLLAGQFQFAIVQSDRAHEAWNGLGTWKNWGKQTELRSLFSLHAEMVTLIANDSSAIESCQNLKGKRVSIGPVGSGTHKNSLDALNSCDLGVEDLGEAMNLSNKDMLRAFQRNQLDAFFFTVGHPNKAISQLLRANSLGPRLIPIQVSNALLQSNPFYTRTQIPVGVYPELGQTTDIPTFGVRAVFMTTRQVSEETVYLFTKEVLTQLATLQASQPTLSQLNRESMLSEGLSAPFHAGAMTYFRESGLQP